MSQAGKKSNKCPAKECFRNFCSKHPIAIQRARIITGTIVGITIVVFMIPFVINELYKMGPGYVTEWHAEDVLSFYGALLSCVGTVVLGVVAIKQNDRSNQLNEQLQKIQQAEYVSMVEAKSIFLEKRSSATQNFVNPHAQNQNIFLIDLTANKFSSQESYYIDVKFENDSKYPIVQMRVHPGCRDKVNGTIYGMQNWIDKAVYIPQSGNAWFRFIIPCKIFEKVNKYELQLSIDFVNVFDYTTSANLIFPDLRKSGQYRDFQYRLLKFIDVKPT